MGREKNFAEGTRAEKPRAARRAQAKRDAGFTPERDKTGVMIRLDAQEIAALDALRGGDSRNLVCRDIVRQALGMTAL